MVGWLVGWMVGWQYQLAPLNEILTSMRQAWMATLGSGEAFEAMAGGEPIASPAQLEDLLRRAGTLSLSSLSLSLSLSLFLSLALSLSLSIPLSLALSLSLFHTHTHCLAPSLSNSSSPSVCLFLSLFLSLSLFFSLFLSSSPRKPPLSLCGTESPSFQPQDRFSPFELKSEVVPP